MKKKANKTEIIIWLDLEYFKTNSCMCPNGIYLVYTCQFKNEIEKISNKCKCLISHTINGQTWNSNKDNEIIPCDLLCENWCKNTN